MRAPLLLAASALFFTACSSGGNILGGLDTRQNAGPCPTAGALYEASRVVEFADDDPEAIGYSNIAYSGEITGVRLYCRYVDDEPLLAEIEIDFALGKGDAGTANAKQFEYWVTVMRRNSRILEKKKFTVDADFRRDRITETTEVINRIFIPRADRTISGANFEVLVGFELTEAQTDFNKQGQRFRLDAGGK